MFRMFWKGGGGRDSFISTCFILCVCVEYKGYNLIVKINKMKQSPPPSLNCNLSSKLSLELFAVGHFFYSVISFISALLCKAPKEINIYLPR